VQQHNRLYNNLHRIDLSESNVWAVQQKRKVIRYSSIQFIWLQQCW